VLRQVVADASAIVEYLLRTDRAPAIEAIVVDPDVDVHVPFLCDVEVASALRRGLRDGRLDDRHASRVLEAYLDLPLIRHGHTDLLARALDLRDNFTSYDAMYVVLAERLSAALLTGDASLDRATRRHSRIEILPTPE
jgi:predicted nucleic acid-binding protein